MKIALNLFPITKIGGILTFHTELEKGLVALGHEVDNYYISVNKKVKDTPDIPIKFKGVLGFERPDWIETYKTIMENYDVVVFIHPCPTQTKEYTSTAWKECYNLKNPRIVSCFHDAYWSENYPWLKLVFDKITKAACIQRKSYEIMPYFAPFKKEIIGHPLDLTGLGYYTEVKEDLVICANQFRSWKHNDLFIMSIPLLNKNVKNEVFNDGIVRCKMSGKERDERYKDEQGNWIWEKALAHGMNYRGHVTEAELIDALKRQKCAVNLATGENAHKKGDDYKSLDYSVLECMKYGGIPVVRKYSVLKPYFKDSNFAVVDEKDIINSTALNVNRIIENFDEFKDIIDSNFAVLKQEYDAKIVAKRLLEGVN